MGVGVFWVPALWCLRVNPARRAHVDTESAD